MSGLVIRVENLSKKYILSHQQEGRSRYKSLRESISNGVDSLCQRVLNLSSKENISPNREEFWALKDICLEIQQGASLRHGAKGAIAWGLLAGMMSLNQLF